jgi:hypothetical protein
MKDKLVKRFVIGTFVTLYLLVSIISTIHVIDFFEMSNPYWLAVTLAIGFEIGAAASLASLVILDKMNKTIVWALFLAITLMQMQGNMYYAFINLGDFTAWSELFNLIEEDVLYQKRILAFVSGAILPLIALGFIKSLVDYIKPTEDEEIVSEGILGEEPLDEDEDLAKDWDSTINDGLKDEELKSEYHESIIADRENDTEEEWDEDHALDMIMNDMVKDMDVNDFEEIRVENVPIEPVDYTINPTSVGSIVEKLDSMHLPQNEQELLNQALRDKANKNKESFIKKDRNDS